MNEEQISGAPIGGYKTDHLIYVDNFNEFKFTQLYRFIRLRVLWIIAVRYEYVDGRFRYPETTKLVKELEENIPSNSTLSEAYARAQGKVELIESIYNGQPRLAHMNQMTEEFIKFFFDIFRCNARFMAAFLYLFMNESYNEFLENTPTDPKKGRTESKFPYTWTAKYDESVLRSNYYDEVDLMFYIFEHVLPRKEILQLNNTSAAFMYSTFFTPNDFDRTKNYMINSSMRISDCGDMVRSIYPYKNQKQSSIVKRNFGYWSYQREHIRLKTKLLQPPEKIESEEDALEEIENSFRLMFIQPQPKTTTTTTVEEAENAIELFTMEIQPNLYVKG